MEAFRVLRNLTTAVIGLVAVLVGAFAHEEVLFESAPIIQEAGVTTEDQAAFIPYSYEGGNETAFRSDSRIQLGLGQGGHARLSNIAPWGRMEPGPVAANQRCERNTRPQQGWVALRL